MTADPLYVAAYWGPRAEAVEGCAARFAACLEAMAAVSPLLDGWRPKGRSQAEAIAQETVDVERLADLLRRGAQRRDAGGAPMPELGFRAALWNGVSSAAATLSVTCGSTTPAVPNTCVVGLPAPGPSTEELYHRPAVEDLVRGLVDAWSPDWAVATSHRLRNATAAGATGPSLGWLTYLAGIDAVPEADSAFMATPAPSGGVLVALADEWSDVDSDRVMAAHRSLTRDGVLGHTGG